MPSSARLYKTEAIVIRQRRLGEADRFLTLYTPAHGKFDVKAKSVRKTTSRLSGHLQPLNHCMMQLAQGHAGDVVTGVETLESYQGLRDDLDSLSRALYVAELTDRMTVEHVHSFPTFRLVLETLRRLNEGEGDVALRFFEMRFLDQSGFRPQVDVCVGCGRELEATDNFFAPAAGGAVCRVCVPGLAGPRMLSLNALKMLRLLQRAPYNEVARIRMPAELGEELERHLRSYVIAVLERDVNAASFIERIRRLGPRAMVEVSDAAV